MLKLRYEGEKINLHEKKKNIYADNIRHDKER